MLLITANTATDEIIPPRWFTFITATTSCIQVTVIFTEKSGAIKNNFLPQYINH